MIETTVYTTSDDVKPMVDWNLDSRAGNAIVKPERKIRKKTTSKIVDSSRLRKSKPLGSTINNHLFHSKKKLSSKKPLVVRKVKRDSFGNVVSSL